MRRSLVGLFLASIVVFSMTGSLWAQAPNNPVGLWRFFAFDDTTPGMSALASQDICFRSNGTWFGVNFAGWAGTWFQKGGNLAGNGNRVRMVGNFATGGGNDSSEMNFVNVSLMTGDWNEFLDLAPSGAGFVLFLKMRADFLGRLCPAGTSLILELNRAKAPFEKQ